MSILIGSWNLLYRIIYMGPEQVILFGYVYSWTSDTFWLCLLLNKGCWRGWYKCDAASLVMWQWAPLYQWPYRLVEPVLRNQCWKTRQSAPSGRRVWRAPVGVWAQSFLCGPKGNRRYCHSLRTGWSLCFWSHIKIVNHNIYNYKVCT